MKKIKPLTLALCTILFCLLLGGGVFAMSRFMGSSQKENTKVGRVESIDGNTVEVMLGTLENSDVENSQGKGGVIETPMGENSDKTKNGNGDADDDGANENGQSQDSKSPQNPSSKNRDNGTKNQNDGSSDTDAITEATPTQDSTNASLNGDPEYEVSLKAANQEQKDTDDGGQKDSAGNDSNSTKSQNGNSSNPSGNGNSNGMPPEPPNGFDGEPPELPEGMDGTEPPEMPDGETPPDLPEGMDNMTPPEMPENEDGSTPQMPGGGQKGNRGPGGRGLGEFVESGETIKINLDDSWIEHLKVGDYLQITFGADDKIEDIEMLKGNIGGPMQNGGPNGAEGSGDSGTSAETVDSDSTLSDKKYESTTADQNALRTDNTATVTLEGSTVTKSGDSTSLDDSNFYGLNAGVLALGKSNLTVKDSEISTDGSGANALFSYGSGTKLTVSDTKITTKKDNSGGIQTAGGGSTTANNLTIETSGNSAAAIRSDRGGGTVDVTEGNYTTNGTGSPAIYSTAKISAKDATLTANSSEAVVVEGKNSVKLENCTVTGNMTGTYKDGDEVIHNVMIYQSMSGDADEGEGSFSMSGGKLTAKAGDMFYVTNTDADIELSNVELIPANDTLLRVSGNDGKRGWGEAGSNGADTEFKASKQKLSGNIIVDDISKLDLELKEGSSYSGAINSDGAAGDVEVKLDDSSKWELTADSYISEFDGDTKNVTANGHHLFVNGKQVL